MIKNEDGPNKENQLQDHTSNNGNVNSIDYDHADKNDSSIDCGDGHLIAQRNYLYLKL